MVKLLFILVTIIVFIGGGFWVYLSMTKTQKMPVAIQVQSPQSNSEKGVLTIGENIDEDGLDADKKEFQPFIDYLVSKLADQGISKGVFVGTKSVSVMASLVREGKIDVIIDSPFPVYVVDKLAGASLIANRWKGGVEKYHSAFFVKKDSPIKTINDLKGKIVAMDSYSSTAGYFLPKAELIKQGFTFVEKKSPTDLVGPNEIGYTLVGSNIYDDVAKGILPVGVENDFEIQDHFGNQFNQYRYVAITPDVLRFLVATRGDINPQLKDAIKNTLVSMDQTAEGQKVLDAFSQTKKFTLVENSGTTYGEITNLTNLVEEEIVRQ